MSKIVSIGTALPHYRHRQEDILLFMQIVYAASEAEKRKLRYLYAQSGIENRYSVLNDYSRATEDWKFYPPTENLEPFPSLEQRMAMYHRYAPLLSVDAIRDCLGHQFDSDSITHLITVSCTGMIAPGLDLQVAELMAFRKDIWRTSVNFMGCYAAIHALKLADALCKCDKQARVLVVCTELCTLHFQKEATIDNITSSMLFGDGAAAALITGDHHAEGLEIRNFYGEVIPKGKRDMAWELSSSGFQMTLSSYVPDLIETDFASVVDHSLDQSGFDKSNVDHWCIHPGGKRILESIARSIGLEENSLHYSYEVLREVGNLSSATILFVLKKMWSERKTGGNLFGAAFGPGLTVETFTATY